MVPEGWNNTSIGDAVSVGRGFAFKSEQYRKSGHPVLRVTNIEANGGISGGDGWKFIDEAEAKDFHRYQLANGDVLIVMVGATTGKLGFVSESALPALLNQNMWSLRAKQEKGLDQKYFSYIARGVVDRFLSTMQGSARGFLRQSDFAKVPLMAPPLAEQRKIAEILSTWDRAIKVAEAQLSAAQSAKRALMQQLFTGKRRFPEFEGEEWKEVKIGEVSKVITGSTPSTKCDHFYDGPVPFVSPADLDGTKHIYSAQKTLTHEGAAVSRQVPKGATLFTCIGYIGKVGLAGVDLVTNQQINAVVPNAGVDNEYLFYALSDIGPRVQLLAGHNVVPIVNKSEFSAQRIKLPSLGEQRRISQTLSAADLEIQNVETQITKLRTEKKALMQQLLTGKRRVVV